MFQLKTEAYDYLIYYLWSSPSKDNPIVKNTIENIKLALENHEPDVMKVLAYLDDIIDPHAENGCSEKLKNELKIIKDDIAAQHFETTSISTKFENPFRRHFDSSVAINLLINPTDHMLQSVNEISRNIIGVLKTYDLMSDKNKAVIDKFLTSLGNLAGDNDYQAAISLGSFRTKPSIEQVIKVLEGGEGWNLPEIMHIHFKFGLKASRNIPIKTIEEREPIGKFKEIIEQYEPEGYKSYFNKLASDEVDYDYRAHLANKVIYESPLYTADPERGKIGHPNYSKKTTTLGLMLEQQSTFESSFPTVPLPWVADAKAQSPNLYSPVTRDTLNNEAVYVAGPSGMASVLLHLMENMGNFSTLEEKQSYLAAICGYVVGGGFHSFTEVLGPAAYCLDLIPGYDVTVPAAGMQGAAPKSGVFFDTLSQFDNEFKHLRNTSWEQHLTFLSEHPKIKIRQEIDKERADTFALLNGLKVNPHIVKRIIAVDDSFKFAFDFARERSRIEIINGLKLNDPVKLKALIQADDYAVFRDAVEASDIALLNWLKDNYPDNLKEMMLANSYDPFYLAADLESVDVLSWLIIELQKSDPEQLPAMIATMANIVSLAISNKRLDMLTMIEKESPGLLFKALESDKYNEIEILAPYCAKDPSVMDTMQHILRLAVEAGNESAVSKMRQILSQEDTPEVTNAGVTPSISLQTPLDVIEPEEHLTRAREIRDTFTQSLQQAREYESSVDPDSSIRIK